MGGTRFIGKPLVAQLQGYGHALTLFTRGRNPVPAGVEHLVGDRSDAAALEPLRGRAFDVIIDSSGRNLDDSRAVVERTGAPAHRFVYVSSAGVYADSELWPLDETAPTDPACRHAGKLHTEDWLRAERIPFTSFRPTYIYGPGNYNPVESWFFDRIVHDQPVPLPGDGNTITQLGHVSDLATAMARCLEVEAATNRIYNCSGRKGVTFRGLVAAAARACGKDPAAVTIRSFDPVGPRPQGPQGLSPAPGPFPHRCAPAGAGAGLDAGLRSRCRPGGQLHQRLRPAPRRPPGFQWRRGAAGLRYPSAELRASASEGQNSHQPALRSPATNPAWPRPSPQLSGQSSSSSALNCSTVLALPAREAGPPSPWPARQPEISSSRASSSHTAQSGRRPAAPSHSSGALIRILSVRGSRRAPQAEPPPARRASTPSAQSLKPPSSSRNQAAPC